MITTRLREAWRSSLKSGGFGRSVALIAGGTVAGQLLVLAASPILTRLYTPDAFGLLAVYVSVVSLLGLVAGWRYELAIPIAQDDESAANVLALSLVAMLATGIGMMIAVWVAGERFVSLLNSPRLSTYLWITPVGVVGLSLYQILTQWALRKKDYRGVARTRMTQGLVLATVQLGAGLAGMGPGGLILGDVFGRGSGSATLAIRALRHEAGVLRSIAWSRMIQLGRRYSRFPLISSGSAFINSLGLYAPALLLSALYGPVTAGLFALAQRVISAPMSLLGRSVGTVYLAQASEYARNDRGKLRHFTATVCKKLFIVGALPVAVLAAVAPAAFAVVFGPEWAEAGDYSRWLGIAYLVHFVAVPVSQTLNVLERQDLQLWWDSGRLILVVAALIGAAALDASPQVAVGAYSAAMLISYVILLALVLAVSSRVARTDVLTTTHPVR